MHKTYTVQKFATLIRMSLMACLSLCAVASVPARAQAVQPLSVEMTMTTPTSITQGEPIILHYQFRNGSGQNIRVAQGADRKEWCVFRLVDESGAVIRPNDRTRPLQPWEQAHVMGCVVDAHSYYQDDLVPTYTFPHPGNYTLSVHVRVPFGVMGDPASTPHTPTEDTLTDVYEGNYQFPLTVTAPNPARLQADAQALKKKATASTDLAQGQALIEALCSMPEAQAATSWLALANDPRNTVASLISKIELANQLVSLHTSKAVDVLADMVWNPDQPLGASASEWLVKAYLVGGNAVKQHIKDIYSEHSVPFPTHPKLPDVLD